MVKKEAENLATGVTRGACDCNFICHAHHSSKLCKTPQTIHGNFLQKFPLEELNVWEYECTTEKHMRKERPRFYLPKVVETRLLCQRERKILKRAFVRLSARLPIRQQQGGACLPLHR